MVNYEFLERSKRIGNNQRAHNGIHMSHQLHAAQNKGIKQNISSDVTNNL